MRKAAALVLEVKDCGAGLNPSLGVQRTSAGPVLFMQRHPRVPLQNCNTEQVCLHSSGVSLVKLITDYKVCLYINRHYPVSAVQL